MSASKATNACTHCGFILPKNNADSRLCNKCSANYLRESKIVLEYVQENPNHKMPNGSLANLLRVSMTTINQLVADKRIESYEPVAKTPVGVTYSKRFLDTGRLEDSGIFADALLEMPYKVYFYQQREDLPDRAMPITLRNPRKGERNRQILADGVSTPQSSCQLFLENIFKNDANFVLYFQTNDYIIPAMVSGSAKTFFSIMLDPKKSKVVKSREERTLTSVNIVLTTANAETIPAVTFDVSRTGISFLTDNRELKPGDLLILRNKQVLRIVRKEKKGNQYFYGCAFQN